MTTITSADTAVQTPFDDAGFDEAQLAAASFLARYSGRTLEAYRQDLRGFFHWAADHDVPVLAATRPHIELWRGSMDERGLAASTIDRRLSTVCGFYRFAHIDGRIGSNPAEYVRRPRSTPPTPEVWTGQNSACSWAPPTTTTMRTRRWPCCSA